MSVHISIDAVGWSSVDQKPGRIEMTIHYDQREAHLTLELGHNKTSDVLDRPILCLELLRLTGALRAAAHFPTAIQRKTPAENG
jgi:hypothetical protein